MSTFLRLSAPVAQGHQATAPAVRRALAAALLAACAAAWPLHAAAQQHDAAASSATATGNGAGASRKAGGNDDNLPGATRRARADEQRLFGGPNPTSSPYESDDSSPGAQEDALMNEQRMTIVSPSDFYSSGNQSGNGAVGSTRGAGRATQRLSRTAAAANQTTDKPGAPKRYDYGAGASSSPIYRDPYTAQSAAPGQAYRSPW